MNSLNHPWRNKPRQRVIEMGVRMHKMLMDNPVGLSEELLLIDYESAVGLIPVTKCPPGEKTITYWGTLDDPRRDHVTGKINPVLDNGVDGDGEED